MYHTMLPPTMMVQIVGRHQSNEHRPTAQSHQIPITRTTTQPSPVFVNGSSQNGPRLMQTRSSYPLGVYQMMGVELPQIRRTGYNTPIVHSPSGGNWHRRNNSNNNNSGNNAPTMPPPHLNFRPNGNTSGSIKKPNWNNKQRRNAYRYPPPQIETSYSSDSGFSSRSATPNKHQSDSSHTESSDDRDSVSSSIDQDMKLQRDQSIGIQNVTVTGFIANSANPQLFQQQKPLNYFQSTLPSSRSNQAQQNYQRKKNYNNRNSPSYGQKNQRGKKFTGVLIPSFNVYPRTSIAPDRFLARSHLLQATKAPDDLIRHGKWDELSKDIWKKFVRSQQTENTFKNKMMLWKYLYIYIKTVFPRYGLFLVGSTMNGFGSDSSDVDMCLLVRNSEMVQRIEAICHLNQIMYSLESCDFIDKLELIQAKVPILKFRDSLQNLDVDLNCNNAVGIRNTHLLYCYSQIDWRVRPLVLVIKLWAQSQDINDAKNMTISSYSLVLMVIHFLQCGVHPSVLPCLHTLYPLKFNGENDIHTIDIHEDLHIPTKPNSQINRQSLGELLYGFFGYYASFDEHAISVRAAKKLPIDECRNVRSCKNDPHQWKYLCIEEPFDFTNTARSVYDYAVFTNIKTVFRRTFQRLRENQNLADIFVKQVSRIGIDYTRP